MDEILEKIEKGLPIDYDNVRIIGDLYNIKRKLILENIEIKNSEIEGMINLINLKIKGKFILENVKFQKSIRFINTKFQDEFSFRNSTFLGNVYLSSYLDNDADFSGVRFKSAYFLESTFRGVSLFQGTWFLEDSSFARCVFNKGTNFRGSYFRGNASFEDITFEGETDFFFSLFAKNISFIDTDFECLQFSESFCGGITQLSRVKISESAKFCHVMFCYDLILEKVKVNRILIPWDSVKNNIKFNKNTIFDLYKNYESMDWHHDADECYYYYRDCLRRGQKLDKNKIYDYFEWFASGYGVKHLRIIPTLFSIIISFGFIYWRGNGITHNIDIGDQTLLGSISDAIIFSAIAFIAKVPTELKAEGIYIYIAIIEAIAGWLLLAIYINSVLDYRKGRIKKNS
jgi:uncharacterized protein YjbI with pentapeptide repeats